MEQSARTAVSHAERLLDRSEEARAQASSMKFPQTRLQMLKLAETYRHMAKVVLEYAAFCDDGAEDFSDRPPPRRRRS